MIITELDPRFVTLRARGLLDEGPLLVGSGYTQGLRAIEIEHPTGRANEDLSEVMSTDPEWFRKALREYSHPDYKIAFWREILQNSVDAGARNIHLSTTAENLDGALVWCSRAVDDGSGMSVDTLLNKFLRFGGTTKVGAGGAYGGFGVAKELLILPWIRWEIITNGVQVYGVANRHSKPREVDPGHRGTRLTVWTRPDDCLQARAARMFIKYSVLPKVTITVADSTRCSSWDDLVHLTQVPMHPLGKLLRELKDPAGNTIAKLYHAPNTARAYSLPVLLHGMWMFSRHATLPHDMTLNLLAPATQVLSQSRDSLAGPLGAALRTELDQFILDLVADQRTALRESANIFRKVYRGASFNAKEHREKAQGLLANLDARAGWDKPKKLTLAEIRSMFGGRKTVFHSADRYIEESQGSWSSIGGGGAAPTWISHEELREALGEDYAFPVFTGMTPTLAETLLEHVGIRGRAHMDAVAQQLVWEPAFLVDNLIPGFHPRSKWFPETMTKEILILARVWGELCRFVFIVRGCPKPFNVGFVFDPDATAAYMQVEKKDFLVLNPLRTEKLQARYSHEDAFENAGTDSMGKRDKRQQTPWSTTTTEDLMALFALAVHECTHMIDGVSSHNEDFVAAFTHNVARVLGHDKAIRKLVRAVRKQVDEQWPQHARRIQQRR